MKGVFWLGTMVLTQISRSRFNIVSRVLTMVSSSQKSLCSSHISTFWAVLYIVWYIWGERVFLKGLVKFIEISCPPT